MLTSIQSADVTPPGESEDHMCDKAGKGSSLVLKPGADITRSPKQEYQWSHKKDICPPNLFLKKVTLLHNHEWLRDTKHPLMSRDANKNVKDLSSIQRNSP